MLLGEVIIWMERNKSYWRYGRNDGRFDPKNERNVLKYCKARNPNRVLRRKWNAYSKLIKT